MAMIELGGLRVPAAALAWRFVRASGPGGQHVNKVATAVECRLNLTAAGLSEPVRGRAEQLAGRRLTREGEIVVFVDTHRIQSRNRAEALQRLSALLAAARRAPKRRIPTQPSKAARANRREAKRRRTEVKTWRRRPEVP